MWQHNMFSVVGGVDWENSYFNYNPHFTGIFLYMPHFMLGHTKSAILTCFCCFHCLGVQHRLI